MSSLSLAFDLLARDNASKTLDKVGDSADRAGGKFGNLGSTFASAGKIMAVGLAAAGAGAVALGAEVLKTGATLTAWRQKTNVVFEGQAAAVRKWADANNEAFGVTDDELSGLAAGFGDLLKPMGFTSGQAADMSKKVIGLSGALSSWSAGTKTAAEVSDILAKAMLGERDGLKALGISITDADVKSRLAAKGQEQLTGAALEQAKAVATQELIFEKSTDAQKAWADGGNKALKAQNKIKAFLGEFREQLADKFLPVVIKVGEKIGSMFEKALPVFNEVAGGITAFASAFSAADGDITSSGFPGFMERIAFVARQAFDQISAKVQEFWPKIVAAFHQIVAVVGQVWPDIQNIISQAVTTISSIVSGVISVITVLWDNFGNNIWEFVQRVWPPIQQVISGVMNTIQGIIKTVTSLIQGDWAGVWEGIKQVFRGAWGAIQGVVKAAFEALRLIIGVALEVVGSVIKGFWEGIVGFVTGLPAKIKTAASGMWDGIKDAFKGVINWIIRAWNGLEFKIPGFDPPGPGPKFAGFTLGVPNIPELHSGGRVTATGIVPLRSDEILSKLQVGETVLSKNAGLGAVDRSQHVGQIVVHTTESPRAWLDEGLWRVVG